MADNQEEPKKIESEFEKQMKKVIYFIEVAIGEQLSKGITPTAMLGNARSIDQIVDYYVPEGISREPGVAITMTFGDGEVPLEVYRTMDLPNGKIVVI